MVEKMIAVHGAVSGVCLPTRLVYSAMADWITTEVSNPLKPGFSHNR